eukprot:2226627-Amphidinium_carterae.2
MLPADTLTASFRVVACAGNPNARVKCALLFIHGSYLGQFWYFWRLRGWYFVRNQRLSGSRSVASGVAACALWELFPHLLGVGQLECIALMNHSLFVYGNTLSAVALWQAEDCVVSWLERPQAKCCDHWELLHMSKLRCG